MVSAPPAHALERQSVPLHSQIAEALRADIRESAWPIGTSLPSEAALCQRFGVARSVVRQALATLLSEGRIVRDPGRPARVAEPREHHRMVQRSTGLYEQFASSGINLDSRVLRCEREVPPPQIETFFGTRDTLVLERLRKVDGEPLAYVKTWLPTARVPDMTGDLLGSGSLHLLLARRYGLRLSTGRNQIRAVTADTTLAATLQVSVGSPLLMLAGQGLDRSGRPLEWFETWHRADRLVFDVDVVDRNETVSPRLGDQPDQGADVCREPLKALERAQRLAAELASELAKIRACEVPLTPFLAKRNS